MCMCLCKRKEMRKRIQFDVRAPSETCLSACLLEYWNLVLFRLFLSWNGLKSLECETHTNYKLSLYYCSFVKLICRLNQCRTVWPGPYGSITIRSIPNEQHKMYIYTHTNKTSQQFGIIIVFKLFLKEYTALLLQKHVWLLSMLKTVVLLHIFVEAVIHHHSNVWGKYHFFLLNTFIEQECIKMSKVTVRTFIMLIQISIFQKQS